MLKVWKTDLTHYNRTWTVKIIYQGVIWLSYIISMVFPTQCSYACLYNLIRVWNISYKLSTSWKKKKFHILYDTLLCMHILFRKRLFQLIFIKITLSLKHICFSPSTSTTPFHTSSMIKAVFDPQHMAIPSKVVPFIHINPISLVGNYLCQGIMVNKMIHICLFKPCDVN